MVIHSLRHHFNKQIFFKAGFSLLVALVFLAGFIVEVSAKPKGDTIVSGTIGVDTTWNLAGSPYIVTSPITVSPGVTLTIDPGVVVKFNDARDLRVQGVLNANGTSGSPVIFTSYKDDTAGGDSNGDGSSSSPAPRDWLGIYIQNGANASLDYTEIRYGGATFFNGETTAPHYGNLRKDGTGTLTVNHSVVTQSGDCGMRFDSSNGANTVSNTTFSLNNSYGVCLFNAENTLTFTSSTFTGNLQKSIYTTPYSSGFSIDSSNVLDKPIYVSSGLININSYWSPQVYLVDPLTIAGGTSLGIPAGTVVKFNGASGMTVGGALTASGTPSTPVIFTSYKDDTAGGDSNGDGSGSSPAPADWLGIYIQNGASAVLAYADIRYGGATFFNGETTGCHYGNLRKDSGGSLVTAGMTSTSSGCEGMKILGSGSSVELIDSNFQDNLGWGVYAQTSASSLSLTGNFIHHNGSGGVRIANPGGTTDLLSNTLVVNTGLGLWLGNETAATVGGADASGNNIYGNTGLELQNTSTISVDASHNWWGINPPELSGIAGNVDVSAPLSVPAVNAPAYLADLNIDGTGFPDSVLVGEEMTFPLQIGSFGPRESYYVKVSASLPAGVSLTGFTGTGWTCSQVSQDVSCVLATLASWGVSSLEISLISPDPVHLDFDFILSQANNDMIPSNNIVSVDTQVNTRIFLPLVQK